MPLLFVIFALITIAAVVLLVTSVVLGLLLQRTVRYRTLGVFVLLVPTSAAAAGIASSWALAFLADAASKTAATPGAIERWQVLAFWAWPAGFVIGALLGAAGGAIAALILVRKRQTR